MNKFIASGRLSSDIETRKTANGKTVVRFNFAVRKNFKKEGEVDSDFFQCIVFGKLAEVFEKSFISKGTKLILEGEMRNDNYEKDGVKRYGMQFVVNSMEFCESKKSENTANYTPVVESPSYQPTDGDFEEIPDDSDLPF